MCENIEIKVQLPTRKIYEHIYSKLNLKTKTKGVLILQRDTFFHSSKGVVKLREQNGDTNATLIFYKKSDDLDSKRCHYFKSPVKDPPSMREILSNLLGRRGEIEKHRYLYILGQVRIHLDKVDGLGYFLELEVKLKSGQSREEGMALAEKILIELKVDVSWLQTHAYMEILESNKAGEQWN